MLEATSTSTNMLLRKNRLAVLRSVLHCTKNAQTAATAWRKDSSATKSSLAQRLGLQPRVRPGQKVCTLEKQETIRPDRREWWEAPPDRRIGREGTLMRGARRHPDAFYTARTAGRANRIGPHEKAVVL